MKPEKIKVNRTLEGNIFEIVFLVLLIAVWVFIILALKKAPDVVPTHFDAVGHATSYDSKYSILFVTIFTSIGGIIMLGSAYYPHTINIPVKVKTPRQYLLAIRMMRVLSLVLLALTAVIAYTSLVAGAHGKPSAMPILATVGVMFAIIIVFCVLIFKAK
ncbi:Protein of unknown function [Xylanibacter ruminicola]|uniref:DUF1648 domain-containing protein n=1 Tax=Xylanibacter ruminicola TaxID=839 RepID=A0A1H4ET33_XYLRU|nr:DUF1648 domain-containing protein [Xylanibacter ruminicola]SEA88203.1 Protein of unknown function [Xylanibacter ruminicola]